MVKVNDVDISILDDDTIESFINKVALKLETLPKFINTPNLSLDKIKKKSSLQVDVLTDEIDPKSISFSEFYEANKNKYDLNLEEFIKIWLILNENITDPVFKMVIELDIKKYDQRFDIDEFLEKRDEYLDILRDEIKEFKNKIRKDTEIRDILDDLEPIDITDFKLNKVLIEHDTDYLNPYLEEVFDRIECSENIVFSSFKKYIKLYDKFTPPNYWNQALDDVIILKVPIKSYDNVSFEDEEKYNECFTDILVYVSDNVLKIGVDMTITQKIKYSLEEVLDIIREGGLDFNITSSIERSLSGVCFIPNQHIDKYILADLVMNDNIFSTFLGINESNKTSKKKNAIFVTGKFPTNRNLDLSFTLTSKQVEKNDQDIKNESKALFPLGSEYIKIKITRGKTLESVTTFIETLRKLITLYNDKKDDIIKFYRKYIPDFATREKVVIERKTKRLKDYAPDIFLPNYTRTCSHPPEIIDTINDDEFTPYERQTHMFLDENGRQVMLYPKTPEEGKQHYYVCTKEPHTYPGLRENLLSNKDQFPLTPCCYSVDQTTKKVSPYKEYYYGITTETADQQQRIITTNKFVKFDKFGYLPDNIKKLFETIDPDYEYLRKGVTRSVNSFIECVLEGIEQVLNVKKDDRIQLLNTLRKSYTKSAGYSTSNNPDVNISDIKKDIESQTYFDPRKYVNMLERMYNTKIYLFTRELFNEDGYPLIQNYQGFFNDILKSNRKVIVIYEHMGNESDRAEYPQCELIVRWIRTTKDDLEYNYDSKSNIAISLAKTFKNYVNFTRINGIFKETIKLPKFPMLSHKVDSYGKTRIIKSSIGDNEITIFTNIQLPLKTKIDNFDITVVDNKTAIDFFNINEILPVSFYKTNESSRNNELIGTYGGVTYAIQVDGDNTFGLPLTNNPISIVQNEINKISIYNTNKRLSRYLLECLIHVFSKYINDNNLELNTSILNRFVSTIENYEEPLTLEDFTVKFEDIKIIDDNTIFIPKHLMNGLLYKILVIMKRTPNYILEHYKKIYLDFFKDIQDFSKKDKTIIIPHITQFNILSKQNDMQIYNGLQLDKKKYYYSKINGNVFIIYPTINLNTAIYVSYFYNENNHLPTFLSERYKTPDSYTLYQFSSITKYKKQVIGGFKPDMINIGIYKRNNEMNYVAMIPI